MGARRRLLVALVVTGRSAIEIDGLRRALGSPELNRIPPHVTLVPPVNVKGELEPILEGCREAASASAPIEVGLGPPATFAPRNPVVYLSVTGDLVALSALRDRLASGPLSLPHERELRDFVPHVTIATRQTPARIPAILETMASFRRTTTFARVTCFEQVVQGRERRWQSIAELPLGRPPLVGRGGRELTFQIADRLDADAAAFFVDEWAAYDEETYGPGTPANRPFAVSVRQDDRLVAVAVGRLAQDTCELDRLIVAATERGTGIGGTTLRQLERFALEQRIRRIRLRTAADGPAEAFFGEHGFRRTAMLPDWRGGKDFALLERELERT